MNLEEDVIIECPHCGEPFAISIPTNPGHSEFIEDCAVCCRPITIRAHCQPGEIVSIDASAA